jgi:hypothetical protein
MQITIMNLRSFWERHRAHRWAVAAGLPATVRTPKPFQPLIRQESIAILDHTIEWLMDEARATLVMPGGPSKDRRKAELHARHLSIARDFQRLMREQEG